MTVVAIHQPNYLPWLGYFHKICASDFFIILDNIKFAKDDLIKRTKIRKGPSGGEASYLSLPVSKHSNSQLISDVCITDATWPEAHLNKVENTYRKCPFFNEYFPLLVTWLDGCGDKEHMLDINMFLLTRLLDLLGIHKNIIYSSQLAAVGAKEAYVLNLIACLNGTAYISGTGAAEYQVESNFSARGVKVVYQDFYDYLQRNPYSQGSNQFLPGLSVVDMLFNIGAEKTKQYLQKYSEYFKAKYEI